MSKKSKRKGVVDDDAISDRMDAGFLTRAEFWRTYGDEPRDHDRCEFDPATVAKYRSIGDPFWRHILRFRQWHAHKFHPRRLWQVWGRLRRGWGYEDAWSLDHHLARIMAQAGRAYIGGITVYHDRPGFAEWVTCMEHYAAGCHCRHARAAVKALPDVFGRLWD